MSISFVDSPKSHAHNHGHHCLEIDHLTISYGKKSIVESLQVSLDSSKGLWALSGPNGGGKTTLMETIVGLHKEYQGHIFFNKKCLRGKNKKIVYLPQKTTIAKNFPLNVGTIVAMGLWSKTGPWGWIGKKYKEEISGALKAVGLPGFEKMPLHALSGGQMQRVLFARMIVQEGDVLLLDEPFNNMDEQTAIELIHVLLKWQKMGKLILVSLHHKEWIESYFDQVLLLARKQFIAGPPSEVFATNQFQQFHKDALHWGVHKTGTAKKSC
jgi:zinc/manganese transport system ATP-binding protein